MILGGAQMTKRTSLAAPSPEDRAAFRAAVEGGLQPPRPHQPGSWGGPLPAPRLPNFGPTNALRCGKV